MTITNKKVKTKKPAVKKTSIVKTLTGKGVRIKITAKNLPPKSTGKTIAEKAEKSKPASKPLVTESDAPKIECRLIVDDLSLPVDANYLTGLEHTVGGGQWGGGHAWGPGLIDSWPDAAWVALLVHLGLPADPLDRSVAGPPVKRLVQQLWYDAIKGGVPEERKTAFVERDADSAKEYRGSFEAVKTAVESHKERAVRSFGREKATAYTPTDALKSGKPSFGGQQAPLFAFFKAAKFAPATTAQAAEGMVKAGLKTTTKPERIAAFYLCAWVKKGLLTRQ